jgi:hypothetical protein
LNDWFDLPGPGFYRVHFTFQVKDGGFAEGESERYLFVLRKKPDGQP